MKKTIVKRIALTLGIAFILAIAFLTIQFFVRQISMPVAIIGAVILFILISSLPICFFLIDEISKKRKAKYKQSGNKTDKM